MDTIEQQEIADDFGFAEDMMQAVTFHLERAVEAVMKHEHEWSDAGVDDATVGRLEDRCYTALRTVEDLVETMRIATRRVERTLEDAEGVA